jgi:hypothetical protein
LESLDFKKVHIESDFNQYIPRFTKTKGISRVYPCFRSYLN